MPPIRPIDTTNWLYRAGIIDQQQGESVVRSMLQLPIETDSLDRLLDELPDLLQPLSDSLGSFRSLYKFFAAKLERGFELVELREPTILHRALRAFDLGSQPQAWLISQQVCLLANAPTSSPDSFRDDVSCSLKQLVEIDSGRSNHHRHFLNLQRSHLIDIALAHAQNEISIDETSERLSILAELLIESYFHTTYEQLVNKFGVPLRTDDTPAQCALLACGDFGGRELATDATLQLMIVAQCDGKTDSLRSISNRQFFERLAHQLKDSLSGTDPKNSLYSIQWMPNDFSRTNNLVHDFGQSIRDYELTGRTWQRQAFIRIRPFAGDENIGHSFINALRPWVYRRYVVDADVSGVAVLNRKLVRQLSGRDLIRWDTSNPDQVAQLIKRTIELLQLRFGYKDESIRCQNSFRMIEQLERASLLSERHAATLLDNLRQLYDLRLAMRLDKNPFKEGRYHHRRQASAACFDNVKSHLLEVLKDPALSEGWPAEETDLVLDPFPPRAWVSHVLRKYNFSDPQAVYDLLRQMGEEEISILSTRRCRQQFADIAPELLGAVSKTPSPIITLHNLNRITKSIGGKRVLWQLFADGHATMKAMIKLCAASTYLTNQLTQSPGMIDELIDSLLLGRLPSDDEVKGTFGKWLAGIESTELSAEFKRAFQLRIGIHNLLKRTKASQTLTALSSIPDVIIAQSVERFFSIVQGNELSKQLSPIQQSFAVFAIDRYGSRSIGYKDRLDILIVYDQLMAPTSDGNITSVQSLFDRLGQSIFQEMHSTFAGERLFDVNLQWGPMRGKSHLAMNVEELRLTSTKVPPNGRDLLSISSIRPIAGSKKLADAVLSFTATAIDASKWPAISSAISCVCQSLTEDAMESLPAMLDLVFAFERISNSKSTSKMFLNAVASLGSRQAYDETVGSIREIDLALQLMAKSSASKLKIDLESQRKLAFLLKAEDFEAIQRRLENDRDYLSKLWEQIRITTGTVAAMS